MIALRDFCKSNERFGAKKWEMKTIYKSQVSDMFVYKLLGWKSKYTSVKTMINIYLYQYIYIYVCVCVCVKHVYIYT